jgi:hypothetical protein
MDAGTYHHNVQFNASSCAQIWAADIHAIIPAELAENRQWLAVH